jgi:GTPase SAR1 family protein
MKSPFKFLDAYSKEDKDIFFGREKEVEEIYEKLFKSNLLLIYGASGTGKTSLLNCGIANKFQDSDWFPVNIRRRNNILESMRREIDKLALTPIPAETTLPQSFHSLYLDFFKPIYAIFDQFEELFISGKHEEQEIFLNFLIDLLTSGYNVKVIITVREEYLAHFSVFEEKIPNFFDNRYRVEHMTPAKSEEVIVKTCKKFDIGIEDQRKISREIVKNISSDESLRVELTYLQVYLDRLYQRHVERQQPPVVFTIQLLKDVGDIKDVLAVFLEEQIAKVEEPELAWTILKACITSGGTKKTSSMKDIKKYLEENNKYVSEERIESYLQQFFTLKIIKHIDE